MSMTREEAIEKFGEPLTLSKLMEMDGKPVWTKLLVESTGRKEAQLYGAPGTLTCRYGPCNRRNVNENDFCSYFAPKEESAP